MPDEPQNTNSVAQNIQVLMGAIPQPIQDFLQGDAVDELVHSLTITHSLSLSQKNSLHQGILLMLLGVSTPLQFASKLDEAGIGSDVRDRIVEKIATDIFGKLEQVMSPVGVGQSGVSEKTVASVEKQSVSPPTTPQVALLPEHTTDNSAPQISPLATFHQVHAPSNTNPVVPAPAPLTVPKPPQTPAPRPTLVQTTQNVALTDATPPVVEQPHARTMAGDIEAMQPSGGKPETKSAISPQKPPENPVSPVLEKQAVSPASPQPKSLEDTVRNDLRSYGIDPYREPIE